MKKAFICLGIALLIGAADAKLLLQETWDYEIGSSSSAWTGGIGFIPAAWNPNYGHPSGAAIVSGLSFGSMKVSGGAVRVAISGDVSPFGNLRRQMDIPAVSSGDLWVAYLFAFDTAGSKVPADEALQIRSSSTLRTGINENTSAVYIQRGSTVYSRTYAGIKGGETLLYVAKYAGMGDASNSGSKAWVLTVEGYGNMMNNGGVSEANLDSYAVVKAVNNDQSAQTQAGNGAVEIVPMAKPGATPSFTIDELRYGTAPEDVVAVSGQ